MTAGYFDGVLTFGDLIEYMQIYQIAKIKLYYCLHEYKFEIRNVQGLN